MMCKVHVLCVHGVASNDIHSYELYETEMLVLNFTNNFKFVMLKV